MTAVMLPPRVIAASSGPMETYPMKLALWRNSRLSSATALVAVSATGAAGRDGRHTGSAERHGRDRNDRTPAAFLVARGRHGQGRQANSTPCDYEPLALFPDRADAPALAAAGWRSGGASSGQWLAGPPGWQAASAAAAAAGVGLRMVAQASRPPAATRLAASHIAMRKPEAKVPGSSAAAPEIPAAAGRVATATRPALRATSLLTAEATPACSSETAASTVEVSGAIVSDIPSANTSTPGK